jgi:hypothetical protein
MVFTPELWVLMSVMSCCSSGVMLTVEGERRRREGQSGGEGDKAAAEH